LPANGRPRLPGSIGPRDMGALTCVQGVGTGPIGHPLQPLASPAQATACNPFHEWLSQGSAVPADPSIVSKAQGLNEQNFGASYGEIVSSVERDFDSLSGALATPGDSESLARLTAFSHRLDENRNRIHPPGSLVTQPAQKKALALLDVLQRQVDSALQNAMPVPAEWQQASEARPAKASAVLKKMGSVNGSLHPAQKEHERRQLVTRMFPKGIQNAGVYQGALDNCDYVSTFLAVCLHQPLRIDNMIQVGRRPGEVKITMEKQRPLYIDLDKFEALAMRGDLGSQIFERVVAHHQKTFSSRSSKAIMKKMSRVGNIWKDFVPGQHQRFFVPVSRHAATGRVIAAGNFPPDHRQAIEKSLYRMAQDPSGMLGTFALKPESMCDRPLVDIYGQKLSARGQHAFAIVQVDAARRLILLCDPKLPGSRQLLSFDEAFQIGSCFDLIDLRAA